MSRKLDENHKEKTAFQKWPTRGVLFENIDLDFNELDNRIRTCFGGGAHYTVKSIMPSKKENNSFIQTGCGPNFEGGLISQCTCRHDIRATWYKVDQWKTKWLAGFTGYGKKCCGGSFLFYLMKVDDVFTSFKQLHDWYQHKNTNLNNVKRADKNPLGDLYYPKKGLSDEAFSIHDYEMLHSNHPHNNKKNILKDINYPEYTKRYLKKIINDPASLLIGDLEYSFLWKTPIIKFKGDNAPRHGKWSNIKSFLCHLEPAVDVMLPGNVRIDSSKDR